MDLSHSYMWSGVFAFVSSQTRFSVKESTYVPTSRTPHTEGHAQSWGLHTRMCGMLADVRERGQPWAVGWGGWLVTLDMCMSYDPATPRLDIGLTNADICSQMDMHSHVCNNLTQNCSKLETPQISINGKVDKQHIHTGTPDSGYPTAWEIYSNVAVGMSLLHRTSGDGAQD